MKTTKLLPLLLFGQLCFAQVTTLSADGPGDTYELINSVLAPGYDVVEAPDCAHESAGRHIEEVWDTQLNKYVFKFKMHLDYDNDRCIKFDRQRNEIKTYNQSPDNLIGTYGETVVYKWKFKLNSGFQPSNKFTHIHQIKAYGGNYEDIPVVSFITRSGNPEKLQIMHSDSITSVEMDYVDLSLFKGSWVEVTETITYATNGKYNVVFKKISNNTTLFTYNNNNINMWRPGADGVRPKWGVYRSLLSSDMLRDEYLLFADFSIEEINPSLAIAKQAETLKVYPNPVTDTLIFDDTIAWQKATVVDFQNKILLEKDIATNTLDVSSLKPGNYILILNNKTQEITLKFIKK